jgi:hypothetical protein
MQLLPSSSQAQKKIFKTDFSFHATQKIVRNDPARFKIIRCGRKWGKTTLAERIAMDWLGPPNSVTWIISPTYKQAALISWDKFKRIIPEGAYGKKPNDTDLIMTLKNGSRLYLMGSDNPDSLRGPEPSGVIFEEASLHKPDVWSKIIRPNLVPKRAPALFIFTPKGFNWIKDLEDEARRKINLGEKEWACFHYSIYDNPILDRKEIEEARKDCDTQEVWRQEYLAEYESSVGRVFSSFSDSRHVRRVEMPSGTFVSWRAVDWGMRDDTACLWAFVSGRKLHLYREYAENNMSAPAQAQVIKNLTTFREKVSNTAISHDAAKEDPQMKGLTVLWHFRQAGISPLRPSSRDKKNSRAMIQQLLHENRIVIDGEKCPMLRKQMLAYEWKDTTMEKPDDAGNDDLVDALHYLVEMLQFDLFLGASKTNDSDLTQAQIMQQIALEKLEQQKVKFTVPSVFRPTSEGLDVDGNSAGYF